MPSRVRAKQGIDGASSGSWRRGSQAFLMERQSGWRRILQTEKDMAALKNRLGEANRDGHPRSSSGRGKHLWSGL